MRPDRHLDSLGHILQLLEGVGYLNSQFGANRLNSIPNDMPEVFRHVPTDDKDNFIKNLLLDNLLLVDIYNRAKKLHIDVETKRVVFILETGQGKDYTALENVKNIFQGKKGDFITAVDEKSIIVVKEVNPGRRLCRDAKDRRIDSARRYARRMNLCILHTEPL